MKAVLVNSGGKDSLAAALLTYKEHELHSVYIHTGNSVSQVEMWAAQKIAAKFCASHKTIKLDGGPYEAYSRFGYMLLPYKSLIIHSLAAMYAATLNATGLITGQRNDVLVDDWDSRFISCMSMSKHREALILIAPLQGTGIEDSYIYDVIKDEPLWRETIYCLHEPPCGNCPRCIKRADWLRI